MHKSIVLLLLAVQCSSMFTLVALPAQACSNSNTNTTSTNTSNTTAQTYSEAIIINEFLPNPSTDETKGEFIELYNTSNTAIDLTDWQLSDATDNVYTLSGSIGGKQYLSIYRSDSDLALNNSGGDTVELFHPNGQLTNDVEYTDSAADDTSYALDSNSDWQWTTTVTPGKKNTITLSAANSNNNTNTSQAGNTNSSVNSNSNTNTNSGNGAATTLQLSELLPDPEGSDSTDEWIELYNYGTAAIDLQGWQIADSSKTFTISTTTSLNSNSYIVFSIGQTGISLNNSGETISLLDPTKQLTDSVLYGTATAGKSYARIDDEWVWTNVLTPGETNSLPTEPTDTSNENTNQAAAARTLTATDTMSIAQAKQSAVGTAVVVTGLVNVLPDIFGTQYFYIQDDSSGVQIFSAKKLFPELTVGDTVQIHGAIGTVSGETKINTAAVEDIVVLNHAATLQPIETQHYNPATAGQLVQISGTVQDKSGSTITLATGWELYIKRNTNLKTSTFQTGDNVTVRGIVIANNDGVRVWPRSPEDIITPATIATGASTNTQPADGATLSNTTPTLTHNLESNFVPMIALAIVGGVIALLAGISRSDKIKQWLQQHAVVRVQSWVAQLSRWVGLEKNTTDSNGPSQYHELHPLGKKLS